MYIYLLFYVFILFPRLLLGMSGGETVESSYQYPFSVTITKPFLCGGSIISIDPPWVITAAHCLHNIMTEVNGIEEASVGYGHVNASDQLIGSVKTAIVHPMYFKTIQERLPTADITADIPYDIGLIELNEPFVVSDIINRIPLHMGTSESMVGELEAIGMGFIGYQQPPADTLQRTMCNLTSQSSLRYDNVLLATSDAVLCHGDSGSALLFKPKDGEYMLMGILNRILNAYDPNPEDTSCPVRESSAAHFINSFVKPSDHIEWIINSTQLTLEQLTQPMIRPHSLANTILDSAAVTVSYCYYHFIFALIISLLQI